MKKESFAAILSVVLLFLCMGLTEAIADPMINEIRFESPAPTVDQVIFELNGPHLPTGKALPGDNPRVYFDFPDTAPASKVKNSIPANGNFVKRIRHAYHKGAKSKTRVVFDLIANRKLDFKQDFNKETNTLIITLYPAGTQPDIITARPVPEPESTPVQPPPVPAVAAEKPVRSVAPTKKEEKEAQPMEEVRLADSIKQDEIAAQPEPERAPVDQPVETKPRQEELPRISSIPPAEMTDRTAPPAEEATVIQPMSEVGVQKTDELESAAPVLHSIEFDPKSNRGEMISFKLNGFHPPVVFGIEEDIPRIVCFFKNATAGSELKDINTADGRYVKNIKIGRYENPNNIRVVLELAPGNNYDLQQVFFKDDKIFMMIINKTGNQISTQSN